MIVGDLEGSILVEELPERPDKPTECGSAGLSRKGSLGARVRFTVKGAAGSSSTEDNRECAIVPTLLNSPDTEGQLGRCFSSNPITYLLNPEPHY